MNETLSVASTNDMNKSYYSIIEMCAVGRLMLTPIDRGRHAAMRLLFSLATLLRYCITSRVSFVVCGTWGVRGRGGRACGFCLTTSGVWPIIRSGVTRQRSEQIQPAQCRSFTETLLVRHGKLSTKLNVHKRL